MPHRNHNIRTFCVVCEKEATTSCKRCNSPCCKAHVPKRGKRCEDCEQEFQLILQDKGLDALKLRTHGGRSERLGIELFLPSICIFYVSVMLAMQGHGGGLVRILCVIFGLFTIASTPAMIRALVKSIRDHSSDLYRAEKQLHELKKTRQMFLRKKLKGPRFRLLKSNIEPNHDRK